MVAAWRPDVSVQVAFNAGPNEPTESPTIPASLAVSTLVLPVVIPIWSDLSPLWVGASGVTRGRQYELDQNQAAQPAMSWLDPNEYLNPANTASLYYPHVLPMRQLLWQATWPNPTSGNLMNTNQPESSVLLTGVTLYAGTTFSGPGYDPSFESYTVGDTVTWILGVGIIVFPTVSTAAPFQGTKSLTWTVAAGTGQQGALWTIPCVPGVTYTVSAYVRQSAGNTLALMVSDLTEAIDAFGRTVAAGWGTADVGGAWTISGGTSADYSITPGTAMVSPGAVASARNVLVGAANADVRIAGYLAVDQIATGGAIRGGLIGRWADASNYYFLAVDFNTDQSMTASIIKRVAGVETTLTSETLAFPYSPDEVFAVELRLTGDSITALVWRQNGNRPDDPDLTTTDTALTAAGQVGTYNRIQTGNTNVAPTITWSYFGAYANVIGQTTTTSGSYVRLSQTFTATQPYHRPRVVTRGTAANATVFLDAVQYEAGSSATTFTTSGSTIYPVFRGFVERWPSTWDHKGFLGLCTSTAVDAFEPLNRYGLRTNYVQFLLSLLPRWFWPLNDGAGATTFGEQSGNGGAPLVIVSSKTGGPGVVTAGTSITIPGDPGATGVFLAAVSPPGSVLQPAATGGAYPFSIGAAAAPWSVTVAFHFQWDNTQDDFLFSIFATTGNEPLAMYISNATPTTVEMGMGSGGTIRNQTGTTTLFDGNPHLVVGQVNFVSATSCTYNLYVDETEVPVFDTFNPTTVFGAGNLNFVCPYMQVGGNMGIFFPDGDGQSGTYANVAVWPEYLDLFTFLDLAAASAGSPGETAQTRIQKLVKSAYNGIIDIEGPGASLGVSTVTAGQPVLNACQDITVSEQGNFWVDKEGTVTFAVRTDRYEALTPMWTFGENLAGGEYPYQDDLAYDFDPTFVFNFVEVDNADGVTVIVTDPASQRAYFPRSEQVSANLESDEDAIQLANWLLNQHANPVQRVAVVGLDPAANPALWPVVLGIEVNDRVRVIRRPSAANSGVGFTMSADFFVEQVSHDGVDMGGVWATSLLLSPASVSSDVFIFDSATLGTFDGPGVMAY